MTKDDRELHQTYWDKVPGDATYPTPMAKMLHVEDPRLAEEEAERDTAESLAELPPLPGDARIVELAAGVGRFTPRLARLGGSVLAIDFVADFCAENAARCQALGLDHVEVRAADALETELPGGVDLVFASWLFMYLSDDEVRRVFRKIAAALRPGGWLWFRESCVKRDERHEGEWPRLPGAYPCRYRSGRWYSDELDRLSAETGGRTVKANHVLRVWDDPSDPNAQLAWLWQKSRA